MSASSVRLTPSRHSAPGPLGYSGLYARMTGIVQVFGRRSAETIHALGRRRRKSAKARNRGEVGHRRCGRRYGDLATAWESRMERRCRRGGFAGKDECAARCERADDRFPNIVGDATGGESGERRRAWALPAESRPEWRVWVWWWIGGEVIMRCRS